MPFGPYDKFNEIINSYRRHRIDRVIALVTDEEHERKAKKNIWNVYEKLEIKVSRLPFKDLLSPLIPDVARLVEEASRYLDSERIVIHCNAGVGRSGLVASCIVAYVTKVTGPVAIDYVKGYMQTDLTDEQKRFVNRWAEEIRTSV
jgi:predicted protein tyrosine phosphatase